MEQRAAELIAVARQGRISMPDDPFVPELTAKIIASIRRLKDEALSDFHSSLREVTPLFRQVRRDHLLAASISKQLDRVAREGIKGLDDVVSRLPIARWRAENVFNTYALEEYLTGVANYVANPEAPPLAYVDDGQTSRMLNSEDVHDRLYAAGEQSDLLAWIVSNFAEYPDQQLLQALHGISVASTFRCTFGESTVQTETAEAIYTYYPVRSRPHDRLTRQA